MTNRTVVVCMYCMYTYYIIYLFYSKQNFAVELYAGVDDELDIELFRGALERAGGANYGTGEPNW